MLQELGGGHKSMSFGEQREKKKKRRARQAGATKFIIWAGRIAQVLGQIHTLLQILLHNLLGLGIGIYLEIR